MAAHYLDFKINKPLIPLKIALFCWFSGSGAMLTFAPVFLKQKGLSAKELSFIFMGLPLLQLLAASLSGVAADKLGNPKPVLLFHLVMGAIAASCMLLIPEMKAGPCNSASIYCYRQTTNLSVRDVCDLRQRGSQVISCTFHCPEDLRFSSTGDVYFENYISACGLSTEMDNPDHSFSFENMSVNQGNVASQEYQEHNNGSKPDWCLAHPFHNCTSSCEQNPNPDAEYFQCNTYGGRTRLFVLSAVFYSLFVMFRSCAYRILEVTTMSMVQTHKSDFGRQRVWSIAGSVLAPLASGWIISAVSYENGPRRYDIIIYVFDAMVLAAAIAAWKLDVTLNTRAKGMLQGAKELFKNIDIVVFAVVLFVVGSSWGFRTSFLAWYLEDLGASSVLMGLAPSMGNLLGLPFLFTSNWFVDKIGSTRLVVLGLLGYAIQFTGYGFLTNPCWALMYEATQILTYHLLWVAVIRHSHDFAPHGLTATVVTSAGGIHFGLGKGTGSAIGGSIMSKYGGKTAFRVMAAACGATAILYALFLCSCARDQSSQKKRKVEDDTTYSCLKSVDLKRHVQEFASQETTVDKTKLLNSKV